MHPIWGSVLCSYRMVVHLHFFVELSAPKNQGLSAYEKEYMTILIVVEQWRSYLQLGEFLIFTDQKSLIHLNEQQLHTACQ